MINDLAPASREWSSKRHCSLPLKQTACGLPIAALSAQIYATSSGSPVLRPRIASLRTSPPFALPHWLDAEDGERPIAGKQETPHEEGTLLATQRLSALPGER